jgi:hypothetical protein
MGFKEGVESTPHLHGKWCAGLGALRAQDKERIKPEDTSTKHLRGSVDIDTAYESFEPQASRWDFAIGYQHANRSDEFVYWVETHSGTDNEIKVMQKKYDWLRNWLKASGHLLAKFDKQFVWIPSGTTKFSAGSTQVKKLADTGLFYSGSIFRIPIYHKTPKP